MVGIQGSHNYCFGFWDLFRGGDRRRTTNVRGLGSRLYGRFLRGWDGEGHAWCMYRLCKELGTCNCPRCAASELGGQERKPLDTGLLR